MLTSLVALTAVAPAVASGPVFVVVPTIAEPTAPAPGVQEQLTADRQALARAKQEQRTAAAAAERAYSAASSTSLLSDVLDAQKSAVQLQSAADAAAGRVVQLRQEIDTLESEPQSVATTVLDPFASTGGSEIGGTAVTIAALSLGVPYRWGGADPVSGFDCSGLTMYVYAQLGIGLPHYAAAQWNELPHVDPSMLEPGDLVFFEPRFDGPGHVGIYAGGDSFIEAPHTGDVVRVASLSEEAIADGFVGAARPFASVDAVAPFG